MQGKGSVNEGSSASLEVRYTEKRVSGWGGLVAVVKYIDRLAGCGKTSIPHGESIYR
jgi:hypothetical protein